jgi:flagellar motor switch protein FliM
MSKLLSQEEVDALLKEAPDGTAGGGAPAGIRTIDLTSQERSLRGRLPGLEMILDRFVRALRPSLGAYLGKLPQVVVAGVELVKYGRVLERLTPPLVLQLFRLAPLRGQAVLVFQGPLAAALLEVAFGGSPSRHTALAGREFSPIEIRALERLGARVLADLQLACRPLATLEPALVRSETNPRFASVVAPSDLVVLLDLRIELAGVEDAVLSLCIPNAALDPLRERLQAPPGAEREAPETAWGDRLRGMLAATEIDVTADLGTVRVTVGEFLRLKPGDVLPLTTGRDGAVVVRVAGAPRFVGAPGVSGANNAVRVSGRA